MERQHRLRADPMFRSLLILSVLTPAAALFAAQGDWPQWRGPNRNGVADDGPPLARAWPAGGPTKLWQTESINVARSHGYSTPSVADGRVYLFVTTPIGGKWRDVVYCFDASNGKTLWRNDYPGHLSRTYAGSSTVCVDGGWVYVAGTDSTMYCMNAANGSALWRVSLKD